MSHFNIKDARDLTLVAIPTGSFVMGAGEGELERFDVPERYHGREKPSRPIEIGKPFAVAPTAVTRAQFTRFVNETSHEPAHWCEVWKGDEAVFDDTLWWVDPGFPQEDDHPVVAISWNDAKAYLRWLGDRNGKAYRLLTDAEFEYATRAGSRSVWFWGEDESRSELYVNDRRSVAFPYTAPVHSLEPNMFGLHHMLGNVWEWIEDSFEEKLVADGQAARMLPDSELKVIRGGGWKSPRFDIRSSARQRDFVWHNDQDIGFRVARDLSDEELSRFAG